MDLILDINRNLINQKEKYINNNDVVSLVKFNEKPIKFPDKNKNDFIVINCIFLGTSVAGKEEFINFFQEELKTKTNLMASIGIDYLYLQAKINKENFYIRIVNTSWQEKRKYIPKSYLGNADVILLFYDVTDKSSFEWISDIIDPIDSKEFSLILIANKIDEIRKRKVSKRKGLDLSEKKGCKYYECNTLNGLNIYEILNELILEGYNAHYRKKDDGRILKKSLKLNDNDLINDNTNNNSTCYGGSNRKNDINKIIIYIEIKKKKKI